MTSIASGDPSSTGTGADPVTPATDPLTPAPPTAQPPAMPPGGVATETPPSGTSGVNPPVTAPSPAPTTMQTAEAPELQPTSPVPPVPGDVPSTGGSGGDTGEPDVEGNAGSAGAGAGGAGGETSMDNPMDMPMGGSGGMSGGDDGACTVGSTSGNEVVFIGESFIAASSIPEEVVALARANGSLPQNESYIDNSVSGTRMGDGAIPRQYTSAAASNPIRFVLMNGGGNDCLQANDPNAPIPAAEALYAEMAADGVEKVVYFFYPDAAGSFGGPSSSLQTCLNEYRPQIKALCEGLTAPKCYWLDLAETEWDGNEDAFTSDGIHPNAQGSKVTAAAIWDVMVDNCVAQ